jgi:predicted DNA-binding transcriptional regulator AlpA
MTQDQTLVSLGPVLRTPAAAQHLGLAVSTLEKLRVFGGGPRFLRIGIRAVGYSREDLDCWLRDRAQLSTSDVHYNRRTAAKQADHGEAR